MPPSRPASFAVDNPRSDSAERPGIVLRPSGRRMVLATLLLAHLLGFAAIGLGEWPFAVALMIASHLLAVWGTLVPDSALLSPLLSGLTTRHREVWLTIDDGPSADTIAILDLLDAHRAKATFFLIGERAAAQPALVAEISRRGHGIGNHSASHSAAWFWAAGPATMRQQIGAAQRTLTELTGGAPTLFRAVVGMANVFVAPELERHRLLRVGWTARGFDSVSADPAAVWARLRRTLRPGAILLLHEAAAHGMSVATLALVLQELDRLGYRCVLPELGACAPQCSSSPADLSPTSTATCIRDASGTSVG